jgi:hypothetical protein
MLHVASHWKAAIHIYNLKKFKKIPKFIAFTAACPKNAKSHFGSLGPLGIKVLSIPYIKIVVNLATILFILMFF